MPRINAEPSTISEAVNLRFFVAIDALVSLKLVNSLAAFCNASGLFSSRYRAMRLQYGQTPKVGYTSPYKNIEVVALCSMVANYPISAAWLLTGRGEMLTNSRGKQSAQTKTIAAI